MPHDDWPLEWDDFAREVIDCLHLVVDHQQIVPITWAGDKRAVMVPWERWEEFIEQEAANGKQ